ncbi:MAG TPA: HDIG domain-containing protein [Candidatus Dormibacteraeota bacterium]|jgi:putative nucleotidyltransferase with HDIG domain|nr:HDIG domain-containing protein [Candidatus Dormibacteraeota bacterium]
MRPELDLETLLPEIERISDPTLRGGVVAVWQEMWQDSLFESLEDVPTSIEIHSSHLRHCRAVLSLALAVADTFQTFHDVSVDRDVLLAAGLLQDVSKLVEYQPHDGAFALTDSGRRYPHGFLGAHAALAHGVPAEVCEIIVSHSPTAASFPASLEGKILYYADQLDVIAIFGDRWKKLLLVTK